MIGMTGAAHGVAHEQQEPASAGGSVVLDLEGLRALRRRVDDLSAARRERAGLAGKGK